MRPMIRQGDVLLVPVPEPDPARLRRAVDDQGQPLAGLVVAGERTGHAHRLAGRVYETARGRLMMLERPTALEHEEHKEVLVPAGWWKIHLQREHVPAGRPARRFD